MTPAEARGRLERMVAHGTDPVLTEPEVADLLRMAETQDRWGAYPADAGWEPTYHLAAAAAEGWRWKAAKAAGDYQFSSDGKTLNRQQVHTNCLKMAETFAAMSGLGGGVGSLVVGSSLGGRWPYGADQIANL